MMERLIKKWYSLAIIYLRILLTGFINILLRAFGCTRVYNIKTNKDDTVLYYLLKYASRLQIPYILDIVYPVVGVCTYYQNHYVRYICYNQKLSGIESKKFNISSKNYDSVKKIVIVEKYNDSIKHNSTDLTNSKENLYDIDYATDICDIIKFYRLYTGKYLIDKYKASDAKSNDISKIIIVSRENFNNELLEHITTHEEICYKS